MSESKDQKEENALIAERRRKLDALREHRTQLAYDDLLAKTHALATRLDAGLLEAFHLAAQGQRPELRTLFRPLASGGASANAINWA